MLISRLGAVAKSGRKVNQVTHAAEVGGLVFGGTVETSIEATHAAQVGGLTFDATASPIIEVAIGGEVRGLTFAAEYDGRNLVQHGGVVEGLTFAASVDPVVGVSHAAQVGGLVFAAVVTVPWTPAQITTALWLKEDGTVSSWTDHSGNNRHATQAIATNQPNISNTLNGLTVRTFDGINDFMETPIVPLDSPTSLFVVYRTETLLGYRTLINLQYQETDGARPWMHYLNSDGRLIDWRTGANVPSITTGQYFIISEAQDSTNFGGVKMWRDGNAGVSSTVGGYPFSKAISIGRQQVYGDLGWLQGRIAEIVLVSSAVDTLTRQKIEGYLAHKWGLTANLPADHPYKTIAP